ncbi:MAG: hypothetical protein GY854_35250 [Deltaproteobacteria bacterium]|nr:hypothetical protein [Deltaproteobacteria bacterium]
MANKTARLQRMIRLYKEETGNLEVDMKQVALFAKDKGWPMAEPKDPVDILAHDLAKAAREEIRRDEATGRPYRANHAVPAPGGQYTFWVDIDERPPRKHMLKSLMNRREQMVGDGLQLTYDAEYWNSINPIEEPIQIELDFTFDVELRKHAGDVSLAS